MTEQLHGRALIEHLFGPLGRNQREIMIGDAEYDMSMLLARMDLAFDDMKALDVLKVEENRYALRYYDCFDQRIVVHEFNGNFEFLAEHRAHIAEWIGEDAYYDDVSTKDFRCPLVPGDDF
jgi:hypothetical protein